MLSTGSGGAESRYRTPSRSVRGRCGGRLQAAVGGSHGLRGAGRGNSRWVWCIRARTTAGEHAKGCRVVVVDAGKRLEISCGVRMRLCTPIRLDRHYLALAQQRQTENRCSRARQPWKSQPSSFTVYMDVMFTTANSAHTVRRQPQRATAFTASPAS